VYTAPNGSAAVSGATASSSAFNTLIDDIAAEITGSVPRNGTAAMTADLPMGGNQIVNLGDPANMSDAAALKQVVNGTAPWADAGGTADAITATYTPAITTLVDGMRLRVRAGAANATTTPTFSPNGLTARTITKHGGSALAVGDIAGAGHELILVYRSSATRWELINPKPPALALPLALTNVDINGAAAITDPDPANDFLPLYDLSNTANRKTLPKYIGIGRQELFIPANRMMRASGTVTVQLPDVLTETATNKVWLWSRSFDGTTTEYGQFYVRLPKRWNLGTVTAQFHWSHPTTTVNFGVVWGIQARAFSDGDALEAAWGTAVTVTDTGGATDTMYSSPETGAVTIAGTPATADVLIFRVYRDAVAGGDTMAVTARLHGMTIFWTSTVNTDD
jgi:hypothetical protein